MSRYQGRLRNSFGSRPRRNWRGPPARTHLGPRFQRLDTEETELATLVKKVQAFTVSVMIVMLMIVVILSTVHLGVLIAQEMWKSTCLLMPVEDCWTSSATFC